MVMYDHKSGHKWETPMQISTLQFIIKDSYPVIKFVNEHEISSLIVSGNYCACTFEKMKIKKLEYDIIVGSLNILQSSVYQTNKISVTTPDGTHWVAGAAINAEASDGCPTDEERLLGIASTTIDLTDLCTVDMYVCSNSTSCPNPSESVGEGQAEFSIIQSDGAIQFLIDGSSTTESNTFNPFSSTFSSTSHATLQESYKEFESIENDPRMYIYEVISPGYERLWVHSGLSRYIHARPWLLSILSLSILRPTYIRQVLLHIPNNQCPLLGPTNVEQNTMIKEKLSELSFTKAQHMFALTYNDTYYSYKLTSEGEFVQYEIPFLVDNLSVLLCFIVTCLLAVYSVVMLLIVVIRLRRIVERQRAHRLREIRKFSTAKKKIGYSSNKESQQAKIKGVITRSNFVLEVGLLSAKVMPIEAVKSKAEQDNDPENLKGTARISFFKGPALYLDHRRRINANSFREFLKKVEEYPHYFQGYQIEAPDSWKKTSTRLDILDNEYRSF